ncbi:TPR-like protein [Coniophora puteana RWD-64-598 SS2]|uniref:TPR-like protein n=1 Tax=Coniophora puteana (strain RWD-64-598) TaxID=741705 RepID=R7SDU0_CONPW|nr:TPR-like protein [Coniophora puteana RWD-64-598 SS2]EIW74040.1 TPR-like protein [Coniophora puteana RWD-64-598 SS2]
MSDHKPSGSSTLKPAHEPVIAQKLKDRAEQRRLKAQERREKSDKLREKGNESFRIGHYECAADFYKKAQKVHGERRQPIILSNLAAALLKLGEWEGAHFAAEGALTTDATNLKARFRRGVARKELEQYEAAMIDFKVILDQDPNNAEVKAHYEAAKKLFDAGKGVPAEFDDDMPQYDPTGSMFESESESGSSDAEHEGNSIPCRFYNHDGCKRGHACAYSHKNDDLSVRDGLGKNVCIYFLLGKCKFGAEKCIYSHTKAYLPDGWWNHPEYREAFEIALPMKLELIAASSGSGPSSGMPKKGKKKGKRGGKKKVIPSVYNSDDDDLHDGGVLGFSASDVEELAMQGIKPWDDEAADALAVLNGYY